jgi:hypothetical protein
MLTVKVVPHNFLSRCASNLLFKIGILVAIRTAHDITRVTISSSREELDRHWSERLAQPNLKICSVGNQNPRVLL